jgi:hypothetical protein
MAKSQRAISFDDTIPPVHIIELPTIIGISEKTSIRIHESVSLGWDSLWPYLACF